MYGYFLLVISEFNLNLYFQIIMAEAFINCKIPVFQFQILHVLKCSYIHGDQQFGVFFLALENFSSQASIAWVLFWLVWGFFVGLFGVF